MELRVQISSTEDLDRAQAAAARQPGATLNEIPREPREGEIEPAILPIVAVLIGAAAVAVAKIVHDIVTEWPGGVIIDLREGAKDQVRRSRNSPYGYVLIYPEAGDVRVSVEDAPKDAMERLLDSVIDNVTKSATDIATAIAKLGLTPKTEDVPADDPEVEADEEAA